MKVMTACSSTLGTLDIGTSHFEDVLQTPIDCAEALRKTAVEVGVISHRIVNLLLSRCLAHIKSFCDMSGALCISQKQPAKPLLQPPSESGDRRKEIVLPPDLALTLGRRNGHLFRFDAREPQIVEECPEFLPEFTRCIRIER